MLPVSVATDVLSIQLYTLRSLGSLDTVLEAVRSAGYTRVETVGSHLDDVANTAARLKAHGLTASSSHVSLAALRERPEAVAQAAEQLGITHLFMPAVPPESRDMDAAGWRAVGHELADIAEHFTHHGLKLGYHNHHWELAKKDGDKTALELLFEAAEGSPLTWQVDVAWLVRGGVDPVAWMERYRARITSVHVKDIAAPGTNLDQDGWADVGHGTLDWKRLWQEARSRGAGLMVVEHDKPADPAASARNSYAFCAALSD